MTIAQKIARKKYLRKIKKAMEAGSSGKKHIYDSICQSVDNYILENPDFQYSDLEENFGSSADIAEYYYENLSHQDTFKKNYVGKILIGLIVVLILVVGAFVVSKLRADYYFNRELPVYSPEEYEKLMEEGTFNE